MIQQRHPHPHIDPRQPRDGSRPGTNPPVFAWKPPDGANSFSLEVARDPEFADLCLSEYSLTDPIYLPESPLGVGTYYWRWIADGCASEVFRFEIDGNAVQLPVPPADEWLRRFPSDHPRLYVGPGDLEDLRSSASIARADLWAELKAAADDLLDQSQHIDEPPYLPDRHSDYQGFFRVWAPIMWDSRRFVKGAETLAFAYLVSGDERYGRAACERMASISLWDPDGSSHLSHNDEAHMSVIWHGSKACDWAWPLFTDEERELVIGQFRRRGEITYEHMHDRGCYGVDRFDSHAGREIVFLALLGIAFHEHIPDAARWLDWLRPVLCGIWPVWSGDDGAWAEGPSYGLAYVTIMTMFATALKRGAGVDLYSRPFWRGHASWREWCYPHYAEWIGFGDHSEKWKSGWLANARLVETIDGNCQPGEFSAYISALRKEAEALDTPSARSMPEVSAQSFLAAGASAARPRVSDGKVLRVFPAAGWAAIRTDLDSPASDIGFIFRSSPFGAISHSHASNNDFALHVGGKAMAMPSGYYDGYGSNHHSQWVWHTKSHNCVTLSGAPQIMRSHDSRGAIENPFEDDILAYMRGTADSSYADRADRCRRHVLFLKQPGCIVLVDEFVAKPGITSAVEWNIHSWNEFDTDEDARTFCLRRDESTLRGHFMYHHNSFFTLTEGWDPPPARDKPSEQWYNQHHLKFTASAMPPKLNLGVVLCPGLPGREPVPVETSREGECELAIVAGHRIGIRQGDAMDFEGACADALIAIAVADRLYQITDHGVNV